MNTQLQPLLARLPLLPGESLPSLMRRLAQVNDYEPPGLLLGLLRQSEKSARIQLMYPLITSTLERIVSLTNINPYKLYKTTAHSFANILTPPEIALEYFELSSGAVVPLLSSAIAAQYLRPESKGQFCSLCLKENAYHRLIWSSIASSACLQHKCLLEDTCPECRKAVRIRDIIERNCSKCKTDLTETRTTSVEYDSFGLFTQTVIQSWLSEIADPISTGYTLPKQVPRVLFRVLERLQVAVQRVSEDWPFLHHLKALEHNPLPLSLPSQTRVLTPYQSYCLYATALKGFIDWPRGFHSFLTAYRNRKIKSTDDNSHYFSGVADELGTLYYNCMQRSYKEPSMYFVQEAIEQYLIENQFSFGSSTLFTSSKKESTLSANSRYTSIAEAAGLLKTAPERVQSLIKSGRLAAHKATRGNFPVTLLEREEVLKLRDEWDDCINLREVSDWLGISKDTVLGLVQLGLLVAHRDQSERHAWKFSVLGITECLEHFAKVLQDFAVKEGIRDEDVLSLDQAFAILANIGLDKASLLQQVAENKLCAYLPKDKKLHLGNLLFVRTDIHTYRETIKAERGWIERDEVMRLLQIQQSTVKVMVSSGLISPVAICGRKYYFDREIIEKYKADCINSAEAAKVLGTYKKAVLRLARQGRLPIHHTTVNGFRYLFSREALLKWKEQRITLEEVKRLLGISTGKTILYVKQGKLVPLENKLKPWYFSLQAVLELRIDQ